MIQALGSLGDASVLQTLGSFEDAVPLLAVLFSLKRISILGGALRTRLSPLWPSFPPVESTFTPRLSRLAVLSFLSQQ